MILEAIRIAGASRAIADLVEELDEKTLAEMCGVGVSALELSAEQEHTALAKQSRGFLKRLELLLRFKRELAQIEKLTPNENEEAQAIRAERIMDYLGKL